jgi:hypothetical protein
MGDAEDLGTATSHRNSIERVPFRTRDVYVAGNQAQASRELKVAPFVASDVASDDLERDGNCRRKAKGVDTRKTTFWREGGFWGGFLRTGRLGDANHAGPPALLSF